MCLSRGSRTKHYVGRMIACETEQPLQRALELAGITVEKTERVNRNGSPRFGGEFPATKPNGAA